MTKSKTKQGKNENCNSCKFSILRDIFDQKMYCIKTGKDHYWKYSCSKWRIQE